MSDVQTSPPNSAPPRGRKLDKADFAALADLRYALRRFMAFSEAAATESGLTAQQHQALLAIKASDDALSVGELADRLLIRHHSAGELVDRLARMDMVRRIPSNADRRRVLVALTPLAEHTLDALSAAHVEELRSVGPLLRTLLSYFDSPAYRRK